MLWCRLHNLFDQKTIMESYHNHTALVQNRRTFGFEAVDSTIVKTQRSGPRIVCDLLPGRSVALQPVLTRRVPDLDRSCLSKASPRKELPATKSGLLGQIASSSATRDVLQHFRSKFHPLSFVFDSPRPTFKLDPLAQSACSNHVITCCSSVP